MGTIFPDSADALDYQHHLIDRSKFDKHLYEAFIKSLFP